MKPIEQISEVGVPGRNYCHTGPRSCHSARFPFAISVNSINSLVVRTCSLRGITPYA